MDVCPECGEPVEQSGERGRWRRFCSDRCRQEYHRKQRQSKQREQGRGKPVCPNCGIEFEVDWSCKIRRFAAKSARRSGGRNTTRQTRPRSRERVNARSVEKSSPATDGTAGNTAAGNAIWRSWLRRGRTGCAAGAERISVRLLRRSKNTAAMNARQRPGMTQATNVARDASSIPARRNGRSSCAKPAGNLRLQNAGKGCGWCAG